MASLSDLQIFLATATIWMPCANCFARGPYDVCCFHLQQAAEKYLKCYLQANSVVFLLAHEL